MVNRNITKILLLARNQNNKANENIEIKLKPGMQNA